MMEDLSRYEQPVGMIGFPPPYLGLDPLRLPLWYNDENLFVLDKPAGVLVQRYDWYPQLPNLCDAVIQQVQLAKPELERQNIQDLFPVYYLAPEISGPVIFAKNQEALEPLRNQYGSNEMKFSFTVLAKHSSDAHHLVCDLPISKHFTEPRMIVSHKTGKKAQTRFTRLQEFGRYSLWQVETSYYRMHQICLHATEVGLRIVGDEVYSKLGPLMLSEIKRNYRAGKRHREERPLYAGAGVHLSSLEFEPVEGQPTKIKSPLPHKFQVAIKKLEAFEA